MYESNTYSNTHLVLKYSNSSSKYSNSFLKYSLRSLIQIIKVRTWRDEMIWDYSWRSAGGLAAHHIQGRRRVTRGGPWGRAQQSDETSAMCGITQVEKGIPGLRAFGGHTVTLRECYDLWSRSRTDLPDYRAWSWPIAHDLSSPESVWIPQVTCHKSS